MIKVKDYVVNLETMMFLPWFDQYGNLFTHVMERNADYYVEMEPKALMNRCLGYYGTSLRGAYDGAKTVLGNIKMCPVLMSAKLELYWFSTKSPNQKDCVWFALHHIKDYIETDEKQTKVMLSNGSDMIIDVSLYVFNEKIQRAYQLKGKLEERSKLSLFITKESRAQYQIRKKAGVFNYEIERV